MTHDHQEPTALVIAHPIEGKPVSVRVAEALGFGGCEPCADWEGVWHFQTVEEHSLAAEAWRKRFNEGKHNPCSHGFNLVDVYEMDGRATVPLIERLGISLAHTRKGWWPDWYPLDMEGDPFCFHIGENAGFAPCGCNRPTVLAAVCVAILQMVEAGKLPRGE